MLLIFGIIVANVLALGLGLKMRGFSVKHKFSKYKTIFKLSLMPKSRVTDVGGWTFIT